MFNVKNFFKFLKKNKTAPKAPKLTPEQLKKLTSEIRELTELIGKIWISNGDFQRKIKKIQIEMDNLDRILEKKYFSTLPEKKKQELKRSLIISKQELIKCIQEAPCPTERKQ
ncbi:hypothetical protein JCM13304A_16910 [Desulfothermus okinawensis JCM 13304]